MLFSDGTDEQRKYSEIGGKVVEYSECNGRCIVGRIISTDPGSYLDNRFSPGEDITRFIKQGLSP